MQTQGVFFKPGFTGLTAGFYRPRTRRAASTYHNVGLQLPG